MGHKKFAVRLGLPLLAVAIVIPLASRVNHLNTQLPPTKSELVADGPPIPPVPPPTGNAFANELLIADGPPIPPVPPPTATGEGFSTVSDNA